MSLNRGALLAVCVIIFVVVGYGGFIVFVSWPIHFGNVDKAGVFGDSFGVLTSLFSGLAFAGIVFTILMQKEELALQREELGFTRDELKNQVSATKHQNFESTFFQMLRIHNDIVNEIDIRSRGDVTTKGRDCFVVFYDRFRKRYIIHNNTRPPLTEKQIINNSGNYPVDVPE